eukprot:3031626-Rhodomonas_salina.1
MCSNSHSICAATASSPATASNELSKTLTACSCVLASSSASSEQDAHGLQLRIGELERELGAERRCPESVGDANEERVAASAEAHLRRLREGGRTPQVARVALSPDPFSHPLS